MQPWENHGQAMTPTWALPNFPPDAMHGSEQRRQNSVRWVPEHLQSRHVHGRASNANAIERN